MRTHDVARWLASPLDLKQRGLVLGSLTLLGLLYCALAELAGSKQADLGVAAAWGLLTTLPWLVAFEVLKIEYLRKRAVSSYLLVSVILTAFFTTILAQLLLELAVLPEPRSIASVAISRMPAAVVFWVLALLILNRSSIATPDRPAPMAADLERLHCADVISGAGNYAEARIEGRSCLIRMPLHRVEAILSKTHVRIHRSLIVKVGAIASIRPGKDGLEVELGDGTRHRIGDKFLPSVNQRAARKSCCQRNGLFRE